MTPPCHLDFAGVTAPRAAYSSPMRPIATSSAARLLGVTLALLLAACEPQRLPPVAAALPPHGPAPDAVSGLAPARPPARAPHQMAATANPLASKAALAMLD